MRVRVAKKVLRAVRAVNLTRHRYSTYVRAQRRWMKANAMTPPLTPGGRWNRWDPCLPCNPEEVPF